MRIAYGIVCESCGRLHLIAHVKTLKRVKFTDNSDQPYRLTCFCYVRRLFDLTQTVAYRVSDQAFARGYGERYEYDVLPQAK